MRRSIANSLLPVLGLLAALCPGCIKSVCETKNDCPVGQLCSSGTCIRACTGDNDCPSGTFCDDRGVCTAGCRGDGDCTPGNACINNQCWAMQSTDGGVEGDGAVCGCLRAPRVCLEDINPASATAETLVCTPADPPRAAVLFFGNIGCSHCQNIFGNLLRMESQLRADGFDPTLVFVQLKTFTYTGAEVASTFPTHTGPVLQDTDSEDAWGRYGADWYDVKILDSHGCLSAFFAWEDTESLMSGGQLQEAGIRVAEAWRQAMSSECHNLSDAAAPEDRQ